MDETDIAVLASRLSEAQKRAIFILSGEWSSRALAERMVWLGPDLLEMATPLRTGHERVRLTPLGLAVRHHLANQPSNPPGIQESE